MTPQLGSKMDENSLHPTLQEILAVGLNLKVCHLNIESISASRIDYLTLLMNMRLTLLPSRKHTQIQI
jgi:hypothetical protein